jgi:hypothetical protein
VKEMEYQLRDYRVAPGRMEAFLEVFGRVAEARRAAGFEVVGAWVDDGADRFVWLAGYGGDDGFDAATRRYYDSPQRAAITPEPSSLLTNVETAMLRRVL